MFTSCQQSVASPRTSDIDSVRKSFIDFVPNFPERFGQAWRVWVERPEAVSRPEYLIRLRAYVHTEKFRPARL